MTINKENNKDVDCSISEGTVSNEQNVESVLDFNVVRDNTLAALTPRSVPLNDEREIPRKDYCNAVNKSAPVSVSPKKYYSHQIIMLIVPEMEVSRMILIQYNH